MFGIGKAERFKRDVVKALRNSLHDTLGEANGEEAFSAYVTVVARSPGLEGMPADLIERFRNAGMSIDEASLSHLDASITEIKRWTAGVGERSDVTRVMGLMELAIDRLFLNNPGRIVPRNGKAGPRMDEFATDWQPN